MLSSSVRSVELSLALRTVPAVNRRRSFLPNFGTADATLRAQQQHGNDDLLRTSELQNLLLVKTPLFPIHIILLGVNSTGATTTNHCCRICCSAGSVSFAILEASHIPSCSCLLVQAVSTPVTTTWFHFY